MNPELQKLIYGTILAAIVAGASYAIKKLFDWLTKPKATPVERGQAIADLADAMVDISAKSVGSVRGELTAARDDLARARVDLTEARGLLDDVRAELDQARAELREAKEQRDADHVTIGRLQARVAQLVAVLEENNLPVPPEAE